MFHYIFPFQHDTENYSIREELEDPSNVRKFSICGVWINMGRTTRQRNTWFFEEKEFLVGCKT